MPLRERHKQLTRDRLVLAAQELFTTHGFRATAVAQIAELAGTTSTTFYRHFKSKDDLAWLLQEQLTRAITLVMQELDALEPWTLPGVRGWLDSYYATWLRIHRLCDAFWEATLVDTSLAASTVPSTEKIIEGMPRFLSRFPDQVARKRATTRLTMLLLSLDRVAYLVRMERVPCESSPLFDEFAQIVWQVLDPGSVGGAEGGADE